MGQHFALTLSSSSTPRAEAFQAAVHRARIWAEGCAWCGTSRYLVWSDIPRAENLRYLEEDDHVARRFRAFSRHSNGNTFDYEGRQISFCHEPASVIRYEWDGTVTVLADRVRGRALQRAQ